MKKREIIELAYQELGYADYRFDLDTEDEQIALRRLDSMMASWFGSGISLGYLLPSTPSSSSIEDDSYLPDWAIEAVYTNLAISLAPTIGKVVQPETRLNASRSYGNLLSRTNTPILRRLRRDTPLGSGNRPHRVSRPFVVPRDTGEVTLPESEVTFINEQTYTD